MSSTNLRRKFWGCSVVSRCCHDARLAAMQATRLEGELMNRYASAWILRSLLALAFLTVCAVHPLYAQVDTGSITGIVTDPSGAVVSGAKVTLTNEGLGTILATTTGSDGVYIFSPV